MKKDKITSLQYATLTFFLLNSFLMNVGYNHLTTLSYNDSIFDIIIGGFFILLFSFIIFKIHHNNKGNIVDIIKNNFSIPVRVILFSIIFIVISLSSVYSLQVLVNFIQYYISKEVSYLFITITFVCTILYIVKKGIKSISKMSEIFFYIYLIIIIFGMIGLFKYIDLSNLKPLFTINITNQLKASSIFFISSITPLFLLLIIPTENINTHPTHRRFSTIFMIVSILLMFIELILIISILGIDLTNIYQNPDMIIYKKISLLNILERVETLLSLGNILNSMFFIILCLYLLKEFIVSLVGNKKEPITLALIGIILIILSNTLTLDISIYLTLNILILAVSFILFIKTIIRKYNRY